MTIEDAFRKFLEQKLEDAEKIFGPKESWREKFKDSPIMKAYRDIDHFNRNQKGVMLPDPRGFREGKDGK